MVWHPTKEAVKRLWGRRWVRRVSYTLVAGGTFLAVMPWIATRPGVLRWTLAKLGTLVREETGLSLEVGRLELHPLLGSFIVHDVRLGGDLLTIRRLEVQSDLPSLLTPTRRIYAIRVEQPHLRLTEAGLASLKLKEHPPRKGPLPQIRLDLFSLTGGEIEVPEPLRGLPALHYRFDVKAVGLGPNQMRVDLVGPQLSLKGPKGWERGRLDLNGDVSETHARVREAYLRLGDSQLRASGSLSAQSAFQAEQVEARLAGILSLAQAAHWGGLAEAPATGPLTLEATVQGTLAAPRWTLGAEGQELRPAQAVFQPGTLRLKATGDLESLRLDRLAWSSPQGELNLQGQWSRKVPGQVHLSGENLDLEALGHLYHLPELKGVRGNLVVELQGPRGAEASAQLDRWEGQVRLGLAQRGREAGGLTAHLKEGHATLDHLRLDLETLQLEGTGGATLGSRGLVRLEAEGRVELDASQVAQALRDWKVVDLDMEGRVRGQAKLHWSPGPGLALDGSAQVANPRWHGARVDQVQAKVAIRGTDLTVTDIALAKGEGTGSGQLWLTWGPTAPGQPQIDMCYTAFRLPIAEGLRAADVKDDQDQELPITGTASGWARLQGPFDQIRMTGQAQVMSGQVYGLTIPAASGDFDMDIETLRLRVEDVRVAERPELLGPLAGSPEGSLALAGHADMDFRRWTWWVDLKGRLDSQILSLPGPRIQAQAEARLLGPITAPFGPLDLPVGQVSLHRGRLFFGDRSVEGLEGSLNLERSRLQGRVGFEGLPARLVTIQVTPDGPELTGGLKLEVSSQSASTEALARSLTNDLVENLALEAQAQGRWSGDGLQWAGTLDRAAAQFNAFELHQAKPSALRGNATRVEVEVALEGGARQPSALATQAANLQLSGALPFSATVPLGLRAQGSANLAHLKTILDRVLEVDDYSLLSELRVEGLSHFDLKIHGTYPEPLLDGRLALAQGRMNLRGYQSVEELRAEVLFKDRTLSIPADQPLRGTFAHGDLRAWGDVNWKLGGLDTYTLKGSLGAFQLRDVPDGLDLQGSLDATLEGTEEGGLLKGHLRADRLNYHTEVKLTDLILRSTLSDSGGLTGLDLDDPLDRIRLDLDLDLRSPWSFDTNLLKLEGRTEGPFQVVGTLAHPVPKGTMVFQPGGRVTNFFPAGDMVVDRGSLAFSESRPLDPVIALQGSVSSIPGYTVNLDIRGTLSNLAIVPSSTPSLRQDEVVAILINPGNVANVGTAGTSSGATQGAITSGLASAGSGLISTLAFAPFQEQLRRTLGLDRVNVAVRTTTLGTTETEVTLGKSINLFGQRSAFVVSHKKSGELNITSGQVEWRFGGLILQLGASKGGSAGFNPSGEIRHTWSPK
jgi:hypothetical protein